MKNRKGASSGSTAIVIILALIAAYIFIPGVQDFVGGIGGTSPSDNNLITDNSDCPSSGLTTLNLNVQDALTTTATARDVEYYLFNGNGLVTEGTLGADGSSAFDVSCGKDYKILLINTTTGQSHGGVYGEIIDVKARLASQPINTEVISVGGASITRIENPLDTSRDDNISLPAGSTHAFNILFGANGTSQAVQNPVILCETNISSISGVDITSFSNGVTPKKLTTLPSRLTARAGYRYLAWEYPAMLKTSEGAITASGTITALASVTPETTDFMYCKIVDQQDWKTSSYKVATSPESAFLFGTENTESLANVGAIDSTEASMQFGGSV